jgi:preprotein translocase subunit SecE
MNTKAEIQVNKDQVANLDAFKWAAAAALIAFGLFGYYHYAQYPAAYRAIGLIPVVGLAFFVAVTTAQGSAFWALLREALVEVRRVVWPTRQETTQTTLVVVAVVFVMALVLWGLDAAFGKLVSLIIG